MTKRIIIGDYQVDLLKRRVYLNSLKESDGEMHDTSKAKVTKTEVSVRPKSFELLTLLLQTPQEVVSKETILSTIWDDVNVDEQVIFQSIKELRKAFSTIDAIKTFPRKGYAWVAEFSEAETELVNDDSKINHLENSEQVKQTSSMANRHKKNSDIKSNEEVNNGIARRAKFSKASMFAMLAFCLIVFMSLNSWLGKTDSTSKVKSYDQVDGSIIVMPIKEHLNDRDHKWVKIGGMDLLIQQIPAAKNYGVMQVDDVLEIMKRADISLTQYSSTQIDDIFRVSGAELIIESEISGSPGDYQLVYTLRRKQSIDRGVILGADIYDAIDQLAMVVASQLGTKASALNISRNKLANQLLAQSFDAKNNDQYIEAEQYLKSVLAIEPDNLQAKRMLVEISAYLKKSDQLNELVASVQQYLNKQKAKFPENSEQQAYFQRTYGRILFWQGLNELQFQRIEQAKEIFEEAMIIVTAAQDWLYLGYLAEGQGHLYRSIKQYETASRYYQNAITNHRIIKCPFGEGNNLLHLAQSAFFQEDYVAAQSFANKALSLSSKRELQEITEKAKEAIAKYQQPVSVDEN